MIRAEKYCVDCGKHTVKDLVSPSAVRYFLKSKRCRSCTFKLKNSKLTEVQKKEVYKRLMKNGHPNKGRPMSDEQKVKLRKLYLGTTRSPEIKAKIAAYVRKNPPRKGEGNYALWLRKYGEEEANRRYNIWVEKESKNNARHNLGKSPSKKCGTGWKGWYKGVFFRSFLELAFLCYLFDNNIKFINGETIRIPYRDSKGSNRTYAPDYIIGKIVVEIKPLNRVNEIENIEKRDAAIEWCSERGYEYKIISPIPLKRYEIRNLLAGGELKLTEDTMPKVNKHINKIGPKHL